MSPVNPKKEKEDLDFGIQFYEGILKDSPNFIETLMALGDLYTKKGLYQKGLEIDLRLTKLRPDNAVVFYNLACSHALLRNIPSALRAIRTAIDLGYEDIEYIDQDPDLENLRQDQQFLEYLDEIRKKQKPSKAKS